MTRILHTETFKKHYKHLVKKYPSLKAELEELITELYKNPKTGSPLGHNTFKIRLAVKSKGGGKSGGLRVITFVQVTVIKDEVLFLLTLYDKSDISTISDKELKNLIHSVLANP
ncbi:MAG TPA: type II toxin-antitoxin system RelE/ParE family toxin [Bdellovibrio sp.]|nr:type II toxin-antitoxin system RelE/ParE family toxin [Bdellovibrio sp.]